MAPFVRPRSPASDEVPHATCYQRGSNLILSLHALPESSMAGEVFKICKRFEDTWYNGTLDTCAYFDLRRMVSALLSRNRFRCLGYCVESTNLFKCRSKSSVSTTRRGAR